MAIDLPAIHRYCKKPLARKEFRYDQLERRGLISTANHRKLEALRFFSSGQGMKERFISALAEADETFAADIRQIYQKHSDPVEVALFSQLCMLDHGVFADFNRPNSSGLILDCEMLDEIPILVVLGEMTEGNRNTFSGRVTINNDSGLDSAVVYATIAIEEMSDMLNLWFSANFEENPSIEAQHSCRTDAATERLIDFVIEGKIAIPDLDDSDIILNIWANRIILNRYRAIMRHSSTPSEFVQRVADLHLRAARLHEAAHVAEVKANWGIRRTQVDKELLAYLAEACYINPGLAFRALMRRPDVSMIRDLKELNREIERLGLEAFLESEKTMEMWAYKMLRICCKRIARKEPYEIFNPSFMRNIAKKPLVTAESAPLIEETIHSNPDIVRKAEEAA